MSEFRLKLTENIADARAFDVEDAVALCWGLERMTEERWRWRFRTDPMDVHMSVVYRVELREGGNSPPEYIAEEENGMMNSKSEYGMLLAFAALAGFVLTLAWAFAS